MALSIKCSRCAHKDPHMLFVNLKYLCRPCAKECIAKLEAERDALLARVEELEGTVQNRDTNITFLDNDRLQLKKDKDRLEDRVAYLEIYLRQAKGASKVATQSMDRAHEGIDAANARVKLRKEMEERYHKIFDDYNVCRVRGGRMLLAGRIEWACEQLKGARPVDDGTGQYKGGSC